MTAADRPAGAGADATAKVVDLSAYRARQLREREQLPLFAVSAGPAAEPRRVLSDDEVTHRKLMLRHLETGRR